MGHAMNCKLRSEERDELVLGYTAGLLEAEATQRFRLHLDGCAECREMVQLQSQLDDFFNDWQAPEVSADFDNRLMARIHAEQAGLLPWWRQWFAMPLGWKVLAPVAMAAVAIILLVGRGGEANLPQQAEAIGVEDLEKVERTLDDMEALQALHQVETVGGEEAKEEM